MWLNILIFVTTVLVMIYQFYRRRFNYWKSKGVEGPEPSLVVGNIGTMIKKKLSLGLFLQNIYEQYRHLPFVGIYMAHRPSIVVNDLELIKTIMIKDFAHFMDRPIDFDKKTQPLTDNLFSTVGLRWKSIRAKLTPFFTSNKMRNMFDIMLKCGDDLVDYVDSATGEIEIKEVAAKYTTDAIASCAFGIETNCFKYPDAEFRVMGRKISNFSLRRNIAIMMMMCAPGLQKIINERFVEKDITDFFIKVVAASLKHREQNKIIRNDLLQLLIRLKNKESIEDHESDAKTTNDHSLTDVSFNDLEITAQCFSFFLAGFEPASTTLTFVFHEISQYPEIQEKLHEEIMNTLKKHNGMITYEGLMEMTYATQVIEETLRLHTTAPQIIRLCTKDYIIPGTSVVIEKGTPVFISIQGIHLNPKVYPNPEKFNPENFSHENKAKRDIMTFLTFGEGPRMCIGNKFALIQIKIALVCLLKKYKVKPGSGIKMSHNAIFLYPEVLLKFEKRN